MLNLSSPLKKLITFQVPPFKPTLSPHPLKIGIPGQPKPPPMPSYQNFNVKGAKQKSILPC